MKKRFYNGKILTMEKIEFSESMVIEDDRIIAVGTKEETDCLAQGCENIDLEGKTVMPAFIDAHSHFTQTAMGFLQVSLDGITSIEGIKGKIQTFAKNTPKGEWIQAKDYDHNLLKEGRHPFLEELDAWSEGHPMVVQHSSGHLGLFNTKALKELGITADTKDPEGGKIGRDENGLTGYMEENAYFAALKKMPVPGPALILEGYRKAQDFYASYGIATVQEGMMVKEMTGLYQLLRSMGDLKLDLIVYPDQETYPVVKEVFSQMADKYDQHMKIGGIKIFLDGSPQGRTAWMTQPYEGEETYKGYGTMTDAQVEAAQKMAGKEGVQLLAHCNGDAAAEQYLSCMQNAQKEYKNLQNLRPVMIHAQFLRADQMPLCKELGVIPSFFVAHVYHWGDVHIKNLDLQRAEKMSATSSALMNDLIFTFHQDTPVISPDMLETVWCAVNRKTKNGVELGKNERLSVFEALKAVTINAAWQYFEEKEKGTLSPGKKSDFIIVDKNPLEIDKEKIREIQILETWKDGACIYKK